MATVLFGYLLLVRYLDTVTVLQTQCIRQETRTNVHFYRQRQGVCMIEARTNTYK